MSKKIQDLLDSSTESNMKEAISRYLAAYRYCPKADWKNMQTGLDQIPENDIDFMSNQLWKVMMNVIRCAAERKKFTRSYGRYLCL